MDFSVMQNYRLDYIAKYGTTKVLDIPHFDMIDDSTCVAVSVMELTNDKGEKTALK